MNIGERENNIMPIIIVAPLFFTRVAISIKKEIVPRPIARVVVKFSIYRAYH